MTRILLLTASFGAGHNQAAYAIREALEDKGATVKCVDYVQWLRPIVRGVAKRGLIQSIKTAPTLYGFFYRFMSYVPPSSWINHRLYQLGLSQMKKCIQSFQPDVVVGTFPAPMGVMSNLRESGFTSIPNATVLTDYTVHPQWIHEHTDLYFVGAERVKQELESYHVPSEKVVVTGIPVRSIFSGEHSAWLRANRNELRKRHKLETNVPLILVMGGGEGLFVSVSACEQIISKVHAQFAIVCGHNERLYKRMLKFASERVRVLGYIHEVSEWMAMSDLILTKSGGITITEAFAMELPMLLFRPIPGQEERNAEFAVQSGAAELAHDAHGVLEFLKSIVLDSARLDLMRSAAAGQARKWAADQIATRLLALAKNERVPTGYLQS